MSLRIPDIVALFERVGHLQYTGEPVTQLAHALQCAQMAEAEGASSALISAALLHDLGHLLHDLGETPTVQGLDDRHQYRALPFLRGLFGPATLAPIRLHVDAKRYLCARDPHYWQALSADSKRSLLLQGGALDAAQATQFESHPYAQEAIRLRRWDDAAKRADAQLPPLTHFVPHLARAAERNRASAD